MTRLRYLAAIVGVVVIVLAACTPAATPTPTPTPSPTATPGTPLPPQNLEALSLQDRLAIQLHWVDQSNNEQSFILERSQQGENGPWQEAAVLPANTTTYLDQNLMDKVTYYYRVKARNASGDSAYSNTAHATASDLPKPWQKVDEETWEGKVRATLWVVQSSVRPGVVLHVRVTLENLTSQPVEYTMWNSGDPPVYTGIQNPYGGGIPLRAPGDPNYVLPVVTTGTLQPGQTIERVVQWDVTIPAGSASMPAPNGTYTVQATFYPGQQTGDPQPLVLSHQVTVTDSSTLVLPGDARQAALEHPSVQRWWETHTGQAIARDQKGTYYVNMGGKWEQVSQELYQQALNQPPLVNITLEPTRRWMITIASKYGYPPSEVTVSVNGETGEVTSVTPDLLAELEGGVVATFLVAESEQFKVFVTNPQTIDALSKLQRGEIRNAFPNGILRAGPGPGLHNLPWSWHLDPRETELVEMTTEVCDGLPSFVEEDLDQWLNYVKYYCPWTAQLIDIQDYRQ